MKHALPQKNKTRVWEIDALRGLLILGVLLNHLQICIRRFCTQIYVGFDVQTLMAADPLHILFLWSETLQEWENTPLVNFFNTVTYPGVVCFFIVSGIACRFSRNNLKRGLKMLGGAMVISVFTKLLAVCTGDPGQFIRFGVLHCYAYCHLIYHFLLENRKERTVLITAVAAILVGTYLKMNFIESEFALLYPFGIYERGAAGRDYWPIFPMLGWMLLGVLIGKRLYDEKESRFPGHPGETLTAPLRWLGRHSGILYIAHMPIYTGVFFGIGAIFKLL